MAEPWKGGTPKGRKKGEEAQKGKGLPWKDEEGGTAREEDVLDRKKDGKSGGPLSEDPQGKEAPKLGGAEESLVDEEGGGEALGNEGKEPAKDAFTTALDAIAPLPGDDGRIDIGKAVAEFERGLGRTLTPDEYGLVGDRVFEAVLLESLNAEYEEVPPPDVGDGSLDGEGAGTNGTPGLSELVDAVMAEHPDWEAAQIKAEVLTRVKVTEDEEGV